MHNISLCSLCKKSVSHRSSIKCNFYYKLYLSINNNGKKYRENDQEELCLILKPQKNLSDFFNEFNNLSDQNKNADNSSNCKHLT